MKIQTSFFLLVITLLIGQSCGRTLYIPNMHNVPLMKEKNELRANITPTDFQASYGVTNNIGLMLNGQSVTTKDSHQYNKGIYGPRAYGQDNNSKRHYIEVGIGYFKPIKKNGVFEFYAGSGRGKLSFNNEDHVGRDKFSANFSRYFVQPSIGLTFGAIDIAYSLRYVNLRFHGSDTSEYEYENTTGKDLSEIEKHSYSFREPGLTLRVGWKYVKLHFHIASAYQIGGPDIKQQEMNGNFGLHINIAKRYLDEKNISLID